MKKPAPYTVYSASAGSGKTFTLVKEYLQILLLHEDVFHFQKILAITFTNKAAAEMKQRVLESLQDFAKANDSEMLVPLMEETGLSKETISAKSKQIIAAILRNYSALNITTIDSFTYRIIRSFAYDFGLSMDFDIEMDAKSLLEESVNAVIDQIGIDKELTKVLIAFSLQKSDDDKAWDISKTLQNFAYVLLNESDKTAFASIADKSFNDYKLLIKNLRSKLSGLEKRLVLLGNTGLQMLQDSGLEERIFMYKMLPKFFKNLATGVEISKTFIEGKLRKRFEEETLIKKTVSGLERSGFEAVFPQLWDIYNEAAQLYNKKNLWTLFWDSVVPLSTLSYVFNALEQIKEERNIKLISEFNELIFAKIKDQPTPFIYERLGEKFQHYFIDEMQDTSLLQWLNLAKLIDNAISQEGGSLLLVGDAKQAIYRWRGGESEQFISLANPENDAPFSVAKKVANLDTNYRSFTEIIDFNNSFFQHIATKLQNEAYKSLYIEGNEQKTNSKIGGYVQLDFLEKDPYDEEKDLLFPKKVLQTITNLDKKFQWKDVCVLVRKNKDGVAVASYLTEEGIAVISPDSLLLASDTKVSFLIDLLQSLQNTLDKESRLRSLHFLHAHLDLPQSKHQFYTDLVSLSEVDYYEKLKNFGIHFELDEFHQKSLYDAVEYCVRVFNLTPNANAYLQYFLDEVLDFQNKKGSAFFGFLQFWEQKKDSLSISMPEGQNAVQIMSIHKAKGLQFPIVIFPYDLDIYSQIDPKIWYDIEEPEQFQGFDKLLIPYRASLQFTDELGGHLFQQRREVLELDNYNLLYVALTRAIEQLYIISDYKLNRSKQENISYYSGLFINFLKQREEWQEDKKTYSFGNKKRVSESSVGDKDLLENITPTQFISVGLEEHQVNTYQKEALLWDTAQGEAIDYGNLLHEILAQIISVNDVESVLQRFNAMGLIKETTIAKIRASINAVISHVDLASYFQPNLKVYNERKILTKDKNTIIPDRLVFLPDNKVVIIDYKTGAEESKHTVQIQKYANALNEMGYIVVRKLLVYIGEVVRVVG